MSKHGWKYTGKGERYSYGVPPRDLTAEEFGRLNPVDKRHVMQSGVYEPMTATETKRAEKAADSGKGTE